MFVYFNNEIHYVTKSVELVSNIDSNTDLGKKRKRDEGVNTRINIIFNINNPEGEFAVLSSKCTEVDIPLYNGTYYDFCTLLERNYIKRYSFDSEKDLNDYYWKVSYKSDKTNFFKTYNIYTINKIMNDGFLCTLYFSDEIRHFKFKNLHNNCGDGIITKY
jgi:hypothetical protein